MSSTLPFPPPHLPLNYDAFTESYSAISLFSPPFPLRSPKSPNSLSFDANKLFSRNPFQTTTVAAQSYDDEEEDENEPTSSKPQKSLNSARLKMPTAPWMKGPLLLPPSEVIDLSKTECKKRRATNGRLVKLDRSLTDKVSGGRGRKAMKKIIETTENLEKSNNSDGAEKNIISQKHLNEFECGYLLEQLEEEEDSKFRRKMPWMKEERMAFRRVKKEKVLTAAELTLDKGFLEKLRGEAAKMRKWVKVMKAGVTQAVVDEVHSIWSSNELVMLKFDLPLCRNMDRAREIVEIKTGGLVVWSRKDTIVTYRGSNYQSTRHFGERVYPLRTGGAQISALTNNHQKLAFEINFNSSEESINFENNGIEGRVDELMPNGRFCDGNLGLVGITGSLYEREADRLLDGLGPRFIDWWYPKPLPVDADLLPEVVPGFKPPFRLCPPHVRATLRDDELTYLRKLARPLPTHFVLGRNRKLQGLAVAILKLWEKCIIAKIAVKWGIPNTNNELMASELKCLTGGTLLLRNKFFIILFRGKDFLPGEVANLVLVRETELRRWHLHEEDARLKGYETNFNDKTSPNADASGTLSEFHRVQAVHGDLKQSGTIEEVQFQAEKERLEKELSIQEHKLAILKMKIERSAKELLKLNSAWKPSEQEPDQELITGEERECFRKIGLKMDRTLLLGRRGVFSGVLEGLHQHWKHREVVKVITMQKTFPQVIHTARMLENESGGILVSIDKLKEGHAIIIYRGKNYRRPVKLGQNLLVKRKALQRSLEMQRFGSLKFFAYQRERAISDLKLKLVDLQLHFEECGQREESFQKPEEEDDQKSLK
ncbi:hypothetical protein Nepgr_020863 [Nepenthes gracilis]|uniref:CRM domain-containing protein n=1 Tax=Nepenthes gracilis TaxID=150966 RepID=A0AAD3SYR6_NEPGR|nr:hypothetical protein Nepgr_020863 [Nepenthes gracilis]